MTAQDGTAGVGTALVATGPATLRAAADARPDPSLVAQLLAARLDMPESRRRRRAAPGAATGAYAAAQAALAATEPLRLRRIA
ncbi:MAG TPA: hypothetical protein VHD15_08170 [Hyphomicrobiales bacterium]|nr:hypothetical protein [Hyphomicrobiales bacterium]